MFLVRLSTAVDFWRGTLRLLNELWLDIGIRVIDIPHICMNLPHWRIYRIILMPGFLQPFCAGDSILELLLALYCLKYLFMGWLISRRMHV